MKDVTTVARYFESQPEKTREALTILRQCILAAAPAAEELLNYDIPAYALVPNGKRDQQVMIAGYRNHVGFYPHPTTIEHFAEELSGFKFGKGSVQFSLAEPIPRELVKRMVAYRRALLAAT